MLNYYDDVDYGVRLWRAGYRVVVAPDAWIDHGFGRGGVDSARKQLLCERHRMRVVLKHAPASSLTAWASHEVLELNRATAQRRATKVKRSPGTLVHLPSVVASRRRLRDVSRVPSGSSPLLG